MSEQHVSEQHAPQHAGRPTGAANGHRDDALAARLARLEAERESIEELLIHLPALFAEGGSLRERARGFADLAGRLTGAETAFFLEREPHAALQPLTAAQFDEPPRPSDAPVLAAAFDAAEPLVVHDIVRWARDEVAQRPYGTLRSGRLARSWLAVPVRAPGGTTHGALFCCAAPPGAFNAKDARVLSALVASLAVVLDKDRLLAERAAVAAALQQTLLPPLLPEVPGLEIAARYRPSGASDPVGGDFYDVIQLADASVDIVLGDVSGGGPEAAAITGIARYTARAVVGETTRPSEILAAVNEALLAHAQHERFCTAISLRLRLGASACHAELSRGGHPSALVLRDNGALEELGPKSGLLLGVFADAELANEEVVLAEGDALVLYTDGVIEAPGAHGEQFGPERLAALLRSCAGRTADGIVRRVELAVMDHEHGAPRDDLAVLAVRVRPARPLTA